MCYVEFARNGVQPLERQKSVIFGRVSQHGYSRDYQRTWRTVPMASDIRTHLAQMPTQKPEVASLCILFR